MDKQSKDDLHREAMQRYEASFSAEREQREEIVTDTLFATVKGAQWDDYLSSNQTRDIPRFEINKIQPIINKALGEYRQNRIKIKVRPVSKDADKETAQTLNGIIGGITQRSRFKDIQDGAAKELYTGGMAAWMITTDFSEESFDQEIKLKLIRSAATSVYYDPSAVGELKEDAMWMHITEDMAKSTFEAKWPDAIADNLPEYSTQTMRSWQDRDTVKISDYYVKTPTKKTLAQMADGSTQVIDGSVKADGVSIMKVRSIDTYKVLHYKFSASQMLEGPHEVPCKNIPVIVVFGYNMWVQNHHYYQGMVRNAIDPQRIYNYASSAIIQTSALTPKDPYWVTVKQAEGLKTQFQNFNETNPPFMFYNPDQLAPGPPARTGAPSVQQALIDQATRADMDIQASVGMYDANAGAVSDIDQSGRAILALQKKGDAGTYELSDNMTKAVQYTGKILIDIIPKVHDTEQDMDTTNDDGTSESVTVNKRSFDVNANAITIENHLAKGKYDVISTAAASFATQRSETANILIKLGESSQIFADSSSDLIAKSLDFDEADELTKRVRKGMIAQGLIEPNEEEEQEAAAKPPPPQNPMDLIAMEQAKLGLEQQAVVVDQTILLNKKIKADMVHKLTQTQENLTKVIKGKIEINKGLDELGNPVDMPIEELELEARQRNLDAINKLLEDISNDDDVDIKVDQGEPPMPQPPEPQPPQPMPMNPGGMQ